MATAKAEHIFNANEPTSDAFGACVPTSTKDNLEGGPLAQTTLEHASRLGLDGGGPSRREPKE